MSLTQQFGQRLKYVCSPTWRIKSDVVNTMNSTLEVQSDEFTRMLKKTVMLNASSIKAYLWKCHFQEVHVSIEVKARNIRNLIIKDAIFIYKCYPGINNN